MRSSSEMHRPFPWILLVAVLGTASLVPLPVAWAQADDEDDLLGGLGGDEEEKEKPDEEKPDLFDIEEEKAPEEAKPEPEPEPPEEVEAAPAEPVEKPAEPKPEAEKPKEAVEGEIDPATLDKLKSVQRKPVLKRLRLELTPMIGLSLNDAYYNHLGAGGTLVFYPHDNFSVGLTGLYLFTHPRTGNIKVVRQGQTSVPAVFDLPSLFATLDFSWVPIYGKVSLFNAAIIHFDFYAMAGFGMARAGKSNRILADAGLGQRFLVAEWLSLRVEVRDYIYNDTQEVNSQPRSDIQNYLMLQIGLSVFVPPSFEYSGL